jgi:hypothetical protein
MITWEIRYFAFAGIVMGLFAGFVSCGAQYYKVSLEDDTPELASANVGSDDPKAPNFGLHAPGGWVELPIQFMTSSELTPAQLKGLKLAMSTWEKAVGKQLFDFKGVEKDVTGDSFGDLYSSLNDSLNGHYLDGNWGKTGKSRVVLATTIWENDPDDPKKILTADIRYNHEFYTLGDSFDLKPKDGREVVDMQTLALHELGHLLGLSHINASADGQSIMNPSLYIGEGLANRRLSKGDIQRAQKIYGCAGSACDIDKTLAELNQLEMSQRKKPGTNPAPRPEKESVTASSSEIQRY